MKATTDFEVSGTGENPAWRQVDWTPLARRQPEAHAYDTRFKMLYSPTGLYFLMDATDRKLTATMTEDFLDLWNEDVFEVFLWTDERYPGLLRVRDLPVQPRASDPDPQLRRPVSGLAPVALRTRSHHAQGHEHHRRAQGVRRARSRAGARSSSSRTLSSGRCRTCPPKPGTRWRANFYRMDYDDGKRTQWDWAPVGESFHEFEKFGDLEFAGR